MTNEQLSVLLLSYASQLRKIAKGLNTDLIDVDVKRYDMRRYIGPVKYFHELDLDPTHWEVVKGKEAIMLNPLRVFICSLEAHVEVLKECE